MMIGYNNDVEYRGEEFHIQTEDHGSDQGRIESQIFHEGQILDTENVSYVSIQKRLEGEELEDELQSLMWQTHKGMYKNLLAGEYDELVGLEQLDEEERREVLEAPEPESFEPGQDRVPSSARMVEEHGEEAFEQFHQQEAQKHVTLGEVKEKLGDGAEDEGTEEEQEGDRQQPAASETEEMADQPEVLEEPAEPSTEEVDVEPIEIEGELEPEPLDDADEVEREAETLESAETSPEGPDTEVRRGPPDELDAESDEPSAEEEGGSWRLAGLPSTGAEAWRGCRPPEDDLSITSLVERAFE